MLLIEDNHEDYLIRMIQIVALKIKLINIFLDHACGLDKGYEEYKYIYWPNPTK